VDFVQSLKLNTLVDEHDVSDVLTFLEASVMEKLQAVWKEKRNSVEMIDFVNLILDNIEKPGFPRNTMVLKLCELFRQIDLNGDGFLDWEEFTNFIVQTGMLGHNKAETSLNVILDYKPSHKRDVTKHEQVDSMKFMAGLNRLVTCEKNIGARFFNPVDFSLTQEILSPSGNILGITDCTEWNVMAGVTSSEMLWFWDKNFSNRPIQHETQYTDGQQTAIEYFPRLMKLITAGSNGIVHVWGKKDTEATSISMGRVLAQTRNTWGKTAVQEGGDYCCLYSFDREHTDMVFTIEHMPALDTAATGGMDGLVCLWDMNQMALRHTLRGHENGVSDLCFSNDNRMLLSAGLDHQIIVWNPFVDNLVTKLIGHNHPVMGVCVMEGTPQIVSSDQEGFVRIWDVRTFQCVSTFQSQYKVIQALDVIPESRTIVSFERHSFRAFEYGASGNPSVADVGAVRIAVHSPLFQQILTVSGRNVKFWNANGGHIIRIDKDIVESEITAMILDATERRYVVAEEKGNISIFNMKTGSLLHIIEGHEGSVSCLMRIDALRVFLSAGWDRVIRMTEDTGTDDAPVLRNFIGCEKDVTSLSFCPQKNIISAGSMDGLIRNWHVSRAVPDSIISGHRDMEIVLVHYFPRAPILLTADGSGWMVVWMVSTGRVMSRLLSTENFSTGGQSTSVTCCQVDRRYAWLITGDDTGELKIWDVSLLYKHHEESSRKRLRRGPSMAPARMSSIADFGFGLGDFSGGVSNLKALIAMPQEEEAEISVQLLNSDELEPDQMRLLKKWKAHSEGITSLSLIAEPPSIMTSSWDGRVRLWDSNGNQFASLCQGAANVVHRGLSDFNNRKISVHYGKEFLAPTRYGQSRRKSEASSSANTARTEELPIKERQRRQLTAFDQELKRREAVELEHSQMIGATSGNMTSFCSSDLQSPTVRIQLPESESGNQFLGISSAKKKELSPEEKLAKAEKEVIKTLEHELKHLKVAPRSGARSRVSMPHISRYPPAERNFGYDSNGRRLREDSPVVHHEDMSRVSYQVFDEVKKKNISRSAAQAADRLKAALINLDST
jgi:WD40 repeat protein